MGRTYTGFHASDPISEGVDARFGRVDFDNVLELLFASGELVCPVSAVRLAVFHQKRLWVFSLLEHFLHIG